MAATVLGMGTVLSTQDRIGEFLCPVEDDVAGGVVECAVPDSVQKQIAREQRFRKQRVRTQQVRMQ